MNTLERAASEMSETKELQPWVMDMAQGAGWLCYHTHDSRRSEGGFPDIIAVRGTRCLAVELKVQSASKGKVSEKQEAWLQVLSQVPGIECHVWRPMDWLDGTIREALS